MATRRAETSSDSRKMLLDAASDLFAERGYQQTTFTDLVERTGISRGSISWHFGNKEGLVAAVLDYRCDEVLDSLASIEEMSPGDIRTLLEEQVRNGTMLRLNQLLLGLYVEALKPDSPIRDKFVSLHERIRASLRSWADQAVRLPDGMNADDLSVLLLGAGLGIILQWMITPDKVNSDSAIRALEIALRQFTDHAGEGSEQLD
ncbi:TetR/AcrR family transcriptional regulator [Mycobacteriaceae bacterium NPDC060252]